MRRKLFEQYLCGDGLAPMEDYSIMDITVLYTQ
jgi:hypothetical protein